MKFMVYLKEPQVALLLDGEIDDHQAKELGQKCGPLIKGSVDGQPIYIMVEKSSNVAYIKQVTDEEVAAMRERQKEADRQRDALRARSMLVGGRH